MLESGSEALTKTEAHLTAVGKFLQHVTSIKSVNLSSVHKELSVHLFHLYHSIVLKSARLHAHPTFTQALHGYLQTSVHLMASEFSFLIGQGAQVLAVLEATGLEGSAAACMGLVAIASKDGEKSSHAIYLAFKVFSNCLAKQNSLKVLETMLYLLQRIPITSTSESIIAAKTKLIFGDQDHDNEDECSKWLHTEVLEGNDAQTRKFVYLSVFLLHQWLGQDVELLSKIAGSEKTNETIQTQFMNAFLSSNIIKETLSNALHSSNDKKTHKSLVRLCRLTDTL